MEVNRIPRRLSLPQTTAPTASTTTPETGSRNVNWTASFVLKSSTSTCIPPWLRFRLTPRIVWVSTTHVTCARIGTRVYLRRFDNIPPPHGPKHIVVSASSLPFAEGDRGPQCTPAGSQQMKEKRKTQLPSGRIPPSTSFTEFDTLFTCHPVSVSQPGCEGSVNSWRPIVESQDRDGG
jgi:hypothetical protein